MLNLSRLTLNGRAGDLPAEIYIPLVDSLYRETRTLFLGSLAVSLAVLLTAWKDGSPYLYACWVILVVIATIRAYAMSIYLKRRGKVTTVAEARRWEHRYVLGAAGFMGMLGVWCVVTFLIPNDAFIRLVGVCSTIAYMIGISGRNFGSARLVAVLILVDGVPITIALLLPGNLYYTIYAVLLGAFFISFKFISDRLRSTLLDAVVSARDVSVLATRFDTALNNMPHGLCMFDADRRVVVTNKRLGEILGLAEPRDRKGQTVREFVLDCVQAGSVLRSEMDRLATDIEKRLKGLESRGFTLEKQDGRTLSLTFQAMAKGGSVVLVEDITERKSAEARISHLARYDSLTGLPNRMFMREQMEKILAAASNEPVAVMFVDLDQFKQVNDTLGHPRGDVLLRAVADRLRHLMRSTDLVARFGGDEFVIVQSPISGSDDAAALARRVVAALSDTYEVDGHQVVIGASVGIAMSPRDATSPDHLLKIADMALYWAKADQRGTWRFFEPDMDIRAHARRTLELDLRNALATNAFQVFYQPLFDLKSKRISTCEALVRWPHPLRGMISPGEFIPVAEEMGLIVELGKWVLTEACRTCATWPSDVRVAVNLSANQFRRGNVVETIKHALAETGLDPSRLEIEITESVLFQDTRATRAVLHELRDYGVRISLDDFGTGYSSLSYLQSLPLNKVKIDRSFLEGLESGERSLVLLRGIARLSADLGLSVTVEGIETAEQLALIAAEDSVTEAQGWLFAPALPAREVSLLLENTIPLLVNRVA
ncbi:MAG TPA: EAL domain-containing protein [Bauldia sp.]|nr:EAL domain-containing protein [Bauldia sp.]